MSMKKIPLDQAVGQVLAHDMTQIIPGKYKGPRFRKGHVVREEDLEILRSMGKENIYIWEKDAGMLHEDEAADILRALCQNENMSASEPKEGKIELRADTDGLFKINRPALKKLNSFGSMMAACRSGDQPVKAGDVLAGMRIIPLVIEEEKMNGLKDAISDITSKPILELLPFEKKKTAILTTGSEVYSGRIQDAFTPALKKKLSAYDCPVIYTNILPDDPDLLTKEIFKARDAGAELILCTGGMSVDPDDKTPLAIKKTGADIISYGAPVLPGAMMLVSYLGEKKIPVLGLPGCVMYAKRTVFDLLLPRILANDPITAEDLAEYGEGGLCLNCEVCTWPNCGFGKK